MKLMTLYQDKIMGAISGLDRIRFRGTLRWLARQIAKDRGIKEGSICMFSVVEPCRAPMVKGNKSRQKLELVMAPRKCVFIYHYFDDPVFGFGHVRVQSWVPFNVFICLNGRHWLERQLHSSHTWKLPAAPGIPWTDDGMTPY